jgi:hypothetical protein
MALSKRNLSEKNGENGTFETKSRLSPSAEALLAMLVSACGRYSAPNKNSFRGDHHSQPTHGTHAADHMLAHALGHI